MSLFFLPPINGRGGFLNAFSVLKFRPLRAVSPTTVGDIS